MQEAARAESRQNIVLYGYYGCGNLGDDLLLMSVVAGLRRVFPEFSFFVRDYGLRARLDELGGGVTFTGIEQILADRSHGACRRWTRYFAAWWRVLGRSQWLVFGGGTVFHARGSLGTLLTEWIICVLAGLRRVRIATLGVGISDLTSPGARLLLRSLVGMCDLFTVRDEAAMAQCKGTKARLTADMAFGLAHVFDKQKHGRNGRGAIGLTVYPPACEGSHRGVVSILTDSVRSLIANGRNVVFLILQRSGAVGGDEAIFSQIAAGLGGIEIEMRTLASDPSNLGQDLADIGLICGMRYHAMVVGAMAGIPFAGIAHDNKIAEICRQFRMPCVNLAQLTAAELITAIDAAGLCRPDRDVVGRAAAAAEDSFRLLSEIA